MNKRIAIIAALPFFALAACGKSNESSTTDTSLVRGVDTANGAAHLTTDTVVKTTTVTTDTMQGKAVDTTKKDTTKKDSLSDSAKKAATKHHKGKSATKKP